MTTKDSEKEAFLSRWSRLKQETKDQPSEKAPEKAVDPKAPPPELPPLDQLTPDSDFRGFFHPKVTEDVRRSALKKLFTDPHFNVMDGLDVYIDDYSKSDPIPAAMLAQLRQAQQILEWAKMEEKKPEGARDGGIPGSVGTAAPLAVEDQAQPVLPSGTPRERAAESSPAIPGKASKT
jgi:hypothetical protein